MKAVPELRTWSRQNCYVPHSFNLKKNNSFHCFSSYLKHRGRKLLVPQRVGVHLDFIMSSQHLEGSDAGRITLALLYLCFSVPMIHYLSVLCCQSIERDGGQPWSQNTGPYQQLSFPIMPSEIVQDVDDGVKTGIESGWVKSEQARWVPFSYSCIHFSHIFVLRSHQEEYERKSLCHPELVAALYQADPSAHFALTLISSPRTQAGIFPTPIPGILYLELLRVDPGTLCMQSWYATSKQ